MPSQANPQEDLGPGLLALYTVFTTLPVLAVILRVLARRVAHLHLWWDDWLLLAAIAVSIAQYVILYHAIQVGEGKHQAVVPPENVQKYLKYTYCAEIFYPIVISCVKCSILCLYLRLFAINRSFARICYCLLAFVTAWGLAVLFSSIFQCTPVDAAWDKSPEKMEVSNCVNLRYWLIGCNVPNISADVIIILLPVRIIWHLKLSVLRKIGLVCIFLLAFIATIISILRVNASSHIDVLDVTWGYVPIAEYTTVEANVGILCACLPVLAPLVSSCFKRQVGSHNLEQGAFSANTVNIKHAQTSRREQKSLSLEEDEAALVSSNSFATVSRHPEGTSNQDYANEQDGTMRLGQITVRKDIHVESCVQV